MNLTRDVAEFLRRTAQQDVVDDLQGQMRSLETRKEPTVTYGDMVTVSSGFQPIVKHSRPILDLSSQRLVAKYSWRQYYGGIIFNGGLSIDDSATDPIVAWLWDFGDGSPIEDDDEGFTTHFYDPDYSVDDPVYDGSPTTQMFRVSLKITTQSSRVATCTGVVSVVLPFVPDVEGPVTHYVPNE